MEKTKTKRYFTMPRLAAFFALGFMVFLRLTYPVAAQTLTTGYGSDLLLQRGMIVRIKGDDSTKVEPVVSSDAEKMHGVVVNANDAPVTLSNEGQKVFVATTGQFAVLVSDQNGPILAGDYIAISAVNGVGMKAGTKEPLVIGRALGGFDGKKDVISSTTIKGGDGKDLPINIGRIESVDIAVSRNPLLKAEEPNLPEFLRKAAENIAGKEVSVLKAYISVVVIVITTLIAGSLMYGGVRSAIYSIGRNPLSKKSIIRGMLQVILSGLIVFISGLFGVYLLLKL